MGTAAGRYVTVLAAITRPLPEYIDPGSCALIDEVIPSLSFAQVNQGPLYFSAEAAVPINACLICYRTRASPQFVGDQELFALVAWHLDDVFNAVREALFSALLESRSEATKLIREPIIVLLHCYRLGAEASSSRIFLR